MVTTKTCTDLSVVKADPGRPDPGPFLCSSVGHVVPLIHGGTKVDHRSTEDIRHSGPH